ncbi:hypothetical protein [Hydrogenophaga sp.]|uniref:hypothetical protein n=1 Tax=Hydrogenophaga sp. TaxID=1904254 RepID=UPI0025C389FD|nr:hypothetical protein [Hydrogenophaga sp.]MBT9462530.1 hypothetical protein [Hydrogenophaga sp.]
MTYFFTLEFSHELLVDDDEPSRYVKEIEGVVWVYRGSRKHRAGRFSIFIINVERALANDESVFDIFDYASTTMGYLLLYGDDGEYAPEVTAILPGGERWSPNLLILDRLEVLPKYRGYGIGLRVLRCLQEQFSMGCGLVAMKPFPLQFEGGDPAEKEGDPKFVTMGLGDFDRNQGRATARLCRYYAQLGFIGVPGTDFMISDPLMDLPPLVGS